jgi:hypothetical protein
MKLILALVTAGVASVLPTALADERAPAPKPFTITFSSEIAPVSYGDVRYPTYAGARNLSGSCDVSFAINVAGRADAIRVQACTSEAFRTTAKTVVEAMTFAPRAHVAENVQMRIGWSFDEPAVQTASLK